MQIGLDVMGGDNAPQAILDGALKALDEIAPDDVLHLFGDEDTISGFLERAGVSDERIRIRGTTQSIEMDESPVEAVRSKPDSSLVAMILAASRKTPVESRLDGVISAGNTGACVSAAQMYMRRLQHVHRPGIAVTMPTFAGPIVLIDVGANIEPKPHHLAQYGVMGTVFAKRILDVAVPRIGIMNVGGEEAKGTADMKRARDLLKDAPGVDFVGYVEGREVFDGAADVVITDGVVGNVMLKLAEGLSSGIFKIIAHEVAQNDPELAMRLAPIVKSIYAKYDYHEYGGAPLLGVSGICLISHGSSESRTIQAAIRTVRRLASTGVNDAISDRLGMMEAAAA